ncbi:hypothetical protein DPEC_G00162230 [Dallia pectoralis]|uniref:Uncharacterized protein n=1 Tax=Dallia pectoralis TaxID=75939 RepID=A0ACC2GGH0_DALPE|nr:hypothetical protein DPEC_G00162230 [Dallia pectoralis]
MHLRLDPPVPAALVAPAALEEVKTTADCRGPVSPHCPCCLSHATPQSRLTRPEERLRLGEPSYRSGSRPLWSLGCPPRPLSDMSPRWFTRCRRGTRRQTSRLAHRRGREDAAAVRGWRMLTCGGRMARQGTRSKAEMPHQGPGAGFLLERPRGEECSRLLDTEPPELSTVSPPTCFAAAASPMGHRYLADKQRGDEILPWCPATLPASTLGDH